ncbi:MAG TPA: hypothetical protein VFO41_08910 [Alphaproteobacteria bacterium]|nr:hypothetical protein [Alphaproteobacteria bacterium]
MTRFRSLIPVAVAASVAATSATAQQSVVPPPAVEQFDRFVGTAGPICSTAPAADCVAEAWSFGDEDGNGRLDSAEAGSLRDTLLGWAEWNGNSADDDERALIFLGLSMVEAVGLERLITSYDGDGDGSLSRDELLADVRLDERPLGEVLADPRSVDRAAMSRRLGALGPMLEAFFK